MNGWQQDKAWSDGLLREIKSILGVHLIGEANQIEDQEHGTDLIVLRMDAVRIACRVRRYSYWLNPEYRRQFTIRSARPSGNETELAKILSGWGDYSFYGFAKEDGCSLAGYTLYDLKPFRLWFHRETIRNHGTCPGREQGNKDKSSSFRVFNWTDIPARCIVAQELEKT